MTSVPSLDSTSAPHHPTFWLDSARSPWNVSGTTSSIDLVSTDYSANYRSWRVSITNQLYQTRYAIAMRCRHSGSLMT